MQVLIALGDAEARAAFARVAAHVAAAGLEVVESDDGNDALGRLLAVDAPEIAVVDWDLPGLDGLELCRIVNQFYEARPPYVILVAGPAHDIAAGLDAGASDCVRRPVDAEELRARIGVGRRLARLLMPRESVDDAADAGAGDDAAPGAVTCDAVTCDAADRVAEHDTAAHDMAAAALQAELRPPDEDDRDALVAGPATLESVLLPE